MILYHGSNKIVKNPQVSLSQKYLDFGQGFYATTFIEQAQKWALRKALRYGEKPILNSYKLLDISSLAVLNFKNENEQWLDFVCACRSGKNLNSKYDVIIGNVANDDVFKTVDMYFKGFWDKERTIKELRYYKMNNQYCFVKQKVVDDFLVFQNAELVEGKNVQQK